MVQTASAMMRRKPPQAPDTLPEWLQQVLRQCFNFDALRRPTAAQLHEVKLLQQCIARLSPEGRNRDSTDAFVHVCCVLKSDCFGGMPFSTAAGCIICSWQVWCFVLASLAHMHHACYLLE